VSLGDLHPHDPELEAGVDQLAGDLRLLVHLPHEGADLLLREVADDLPESLLVVGDVGERQAAGLAIDGFGRPCWRGPVLLPRRRLDDLVELGGIGSGGDVVMPR
jgi:hypothetical protein